MRAQDVPRASASLEGNTKGAAVIIATFALGGGDIGAQPPNAQTCA